MLRVLPDLHSIVVYTASCWDCGDCYIGKTKRLMSNRLGWVGRGSQIPSSIHVMYAYFYAVSNASRNIFSAISFQSVHRVTLLKGLCQRCFVLRGSHIIHFTFFINDWKFSKQTRPYKAMWLTRTSFLWLIRISYFSINVSYRTLPPPPYYRKPGHLIRKEFVSGVVSKNVRFARRWNSITIQNWFLMYINFQQFSNSLIIHMVISQSECPSLVRCMYLDTQWKSRSRLLRLVQK